MQSLQECWRQSNLQSHRQQLGGGRYQAIRHLTHNQMIRWRNILNKYYENLHIILELISLIWWVLLSFCSLMDLLLLCPLFCEGKILIFSLSMTFISQPITHLSEFLFPSQGLLYPRVAVFCLLWGAFWMFHVHSMWILLSFKLIFGLNMHFTPGVLWAFQGVWVYTISSLSQAFPSLSIHSTNIRTAMK